LTGMKLVILAMLTGSAFANTAFADIESMEPFKCGKNIKRKKSLSMVMASMATGEKLQVDINNDGMGDTWIKVSSYNNGAKGFHPVMSKLNAEDCSAVFSYDIGGPGPQKLVVVKADLFYELAVSNWNVGGATGKVGIAITGQSAPDGLPIDQWLSLNKHMEINNEQHPRWNHALQQYDCSKLVNEHFVVADMANTGKFYDVYIKDKTMTVISKLPVNGADAWEFRTAFDPKTCSAMMPAPTSPGIFAMRKVTISVGKCWDLHQDHWVKKTGMKLGWSFTLTDPSGRSSPINVPITPVYYPLNRWMVTQMNPIKAATPFNAGLAATKEDKPAVLV